MAQGAGATMTRALIGLLIAVSSIGADAGQPTFRSSVALVRVDASVMDGNQAVAGLTAANFTIIDNGVAQTIDSVSLDRVPLGLMLTLDTSESLKGQAMTAMSAAARNLITSLRPDDAAALMTFADPVQLAVPATHDRASMLQALSGLAAAGGTSINDAIVLGLLHDPTLSPDMRPVMIVFTDGRDTTSWLGTAQALLAARRSRTLIHVVELRDTIGSGTNFPRELAKAGGGRVWSAKSPGALRELFGQVLDELRARYLITYYPAGVAREGWHDVRVRLRGAHGEITARPGYFVTPQ
jgi:VWFA-related protein